MTVVERITLMVRLAIRARRAKRLAGNSRIVGLTGRATTEIAPEGTIFLRNELWRAHSSVKIVPGETVRVTGFAGLALEVDPDADMKYSEGEPTFRRLPAFARGRKQLE